MGHSAGSLEPTAWTLIQDINILLEISLTQRKKTVFTFGTWKLSNIQQGFLFKFLYFRMVTRSLRGIHFHWLHVTNLQQWRFSQGADHSPRNFIHFVLKSYIFSREIPESLKKNSFPPRNLATFLDSDAILGFNDAWS